LFISTNIHYFSKQTSLMYFSLSNNSRIKVLLHHDSKTVTNIVVTSLCFLGNQIVVLRYDWSMAVRLHKSVCLAGYVGWLHTSKEVDFTHSTVTTLHSLCSSDSVFRCVTCTTITLFYLLYQASQKLNIWMKYYMLS
jgi:hypothetical protein